MIKPLPVAMGKIVCDTEICAGCRTCEAMCSLYHEGAVSPALARLKIIAPALEIFQIEAYTCKQCKGPECLYVCPTDALCIDEKTGARVIDVDRCTGCKTCMTECPQYPNTPIRYNAEMNVCFKCDLCDGDPQCVKFCPKSALRFIERP